MNNLSKNTVCILTLISTFVFAVVFYNFLYSSFISVSVIELETAEKIVSMETNVCEIRDSPNKFENLRIKTKATIWKTWDKIYLSPKDCLYKTDNFFDSLDTLNLENYNGRNKGFINLLESDKPFSNEVDVEIIGMIKLFDNENGKDNVKLIAEDIKIISHFRKFEPKGSGPDN